MDHREKMENQREYVESALFNYKDRHKQEVITQLPYMMLNDMELKEYIESKKREFDLEASDEEVAEVLKHFRL